MKSGYIDFYHGISYRGAYPDEPVLSNERLLKEIKCQNKQHYSMVDLVFRSWRALIGPLSHSAREAAIRFFPDR